MNYGAYGYGFLTVFTTLTLTYRFMDGQSPSFFWVLLLTASFFLFCAVHVDPHEQHPESS